MSSKFPITSRYHGVALAEYTAAGGEKVPYLRRRVVPQPSAFETIEEHRVVQGDRLDNVAAQRIGDPQMYWVLCDANNAIRPEELTETVGRTLRIPGGRIG